MTLQEKYPDLNQSLDRQESTKTVNAEAVLQRVTEDIRTVRTALSSTNQRVGGQIVVPMRKSDGRYTEDGFDYHEEVQEKIADDGFRVLPGSTGEHESSLDGLAERIERQILKSENGPLETICLREVPREGSTGAADLCHLVINIAKRLEVDPGNIHIQMKDEKSDTVFSTSPVTYLRELEIGE